MYNYVYFDFETKSSIDLQKQGLYNYMNAPDADIVCLSLRVNNSKTFLWHPGLDLPDVMTIGIYKVNTIFVAFNAYFDWHIWNKLGKKYDFPYLALGQLLDLKALCARYGYPQNLADAGKILGLTEQKDTRGKLLMKKISMPPFDYTQQELLDYYDYCRQDSYMLYDLHKALPANRLSAHEQKIWQMTVNINDTGIPVNTHLAHEVLRVTKVYQDEQSKILPELTDGLVTKITQVQRIKQWCIEHEYSIDNMQGPTIEKAIKDPLIPKEVKEILILRRDLGKSSLAKYERVKESQYKGRIYDNLVYHGTLTGRYSGKGFQIQSLPRNNLNDQQIKETMDAFYDLSILERDPVKAARELIRPTIQVKPPHIIMAADYTAIENRLLSWYAEDNKALQLFRNGLDQYIDMASALARKDYNDITKEERRKGKIIILGCGYGMGPAGFRATADSMNWPMSLEEATTVVSIYRYKYQKNVLLWKALYNAAQHAVRNPNTLYTVNNKCTFMTQMDRTGINWLTITLPTGHKLFYNSPHMKKGKYGPVIAFKGMNTTTHKWTTLTLLPTKIINNVVQATACDILMNAQLNLIKHNFKVIGSLHDEIIIEHYRDSENDYTNMLYLMVKSIPSLPNLPLAVDGYKGQYYRKF